MADTVVQELVINTLTQAQFDVAKEAGTLSPYELYGTPDTSADNNLMNITDGAKELMANASLPSGTYKDLTLGASGNSYTAPADGWVTVSKISSGNQYISLSCNNLIDTIYVSVGGYGTVILPVKKGDTFKITYTLGGATNYFRFIYAEGAKHLA